MLWCDGDEVAGVGVCAGAGAEVIEAEVSAREEFGVSVEVLDVGEHAAGGCVRCAGSGVGVEGEVGAISVGCYL